MLLEIIDVQDADDALLVYGLIELSNNSWDPEDDYLYTQECVMSKSAWAWQLPMNTLSGLSSMNSG